MPNYSRTTLLILLVGFVFTLPINASEFGDAELGKIKSPSCVYCHGTTGKTTTSQYPNLAGQDPLYLFNSMKAYQDGHRVGPFAEMMKTQLRQLDDQDLRDVAAFYASSKD